MVELDSIFDDEDLSSVYRWYCGFNRCRSLHQDEFCEGCQKSVVVPKTIDAVSKLIVQDRLVTYREIETTFAIQLSKNLVALDTTRFVNNCVDW